MERAGRKGRSTEGTYPLMVLSNMKMEMLVLPREVSNLSTLDTADTRHLENVVT